MSWPRDTSQSNSIRSAAKCCLTVGGANGFHVVEKACFAGA
jgi:hypothetical protein